MEYSEGAFPPLGGVTHEHGGYDSCDGYDEWGHQEQEEWCPTKVIGAVMKGKGNYIVQQEEQEEEFKEVKTRKVKEGEQIRK